MDLVTLALTTVLIHLQHVRCSILTTRSSPDSIRCHGHGRKYKTVDSDGKPVCKNCSKCPPGQGVSTECTEYADTVCEPCIAGRTFSGTTSSWRRCEQCSVCASHELMKRECTPTKNRKCGLCLKGYFYNDITGDCDRCSWCFPEYPAIADHYSECNITGVRPGFQCGPIIDPPYPPPMDNMEHTTLDRVESTATTFLSAIQSVWHGGKPSNDREKRTSEVYQTSSDFHFISSRTTPTKSPLSKIIQTTDSSYTRNVLTPQPPIFIETSVNSSVVDFTEEGLIQTSIPPTALGVVLGVLVLTVFGTYCLHVNRGRKRYKRMGVHSQEPLMEEDIEGDAGIVEMSSCYATDNLPSTEIVV